MENHLIEVQMHVENHFSSITGTSLAKIQEQCHNKNIIRNSYNTTIILVNYMYQFVQREILTCISSRASDKGVTVADCMSKHLSGTLTWVASCRFEIRLYN